MTRPPPQRHPHRPTRPATHRRIPWTTHATADAPTPATALHHHISPDAVDVEGSNRRSRRSPASPTPNPHDRGPLPSAIDSALRHLDGVHQQDHIPAGGRLVSRFCCQLPVHRVSLLLTVVYIASSWCPKARSPLTGRRFEAAPATHVDCSSRPVTDRHSPESTITCPRSSLPLWSPLTAENQPAQSDTAHDRNPRRAALTSRNAARDR